MHTSPTLRRLFYLNTTAVSVTGRVIHVRASSASSKKKRLVFLGSPEVSASVLGGLLDVSNGLESSFEVAAIVTQPPSRKGRGKTLSPSPVAQYALDRGFSSDLIFTPERASEASFLSALHNLQPDVCVTAAYGNILPTKFLNIPSNGTVNIHPSLLPLYRGAAPVQRALRDGVTETGVCLAYTVRALDAGPIIASQKVQIDEHIKAPELLDLLFSLGTKLLVRELPCIFDGSAMPKAHPQDDSRATMAPKISSDESWLSFDSEAVDLHNKVRAFAGWPGTRAKLTVIDEKQGNQTTVELKIVRTQISQTSISPRDEITFHKGSLIIPCGKSTILEVMELQLPGKNVVTATAFWNGLRGKKLKKALT